MTSAGQGRRARSGLAPGRVVAVRRRQEARRHGELRRLARTGAWAPELAALRATLVAGPLFGRTLAGLTASAAAAGDGQPGTPARDRYLAPNARGRERPEPAWPPRAATATPADPLGEAPSGRRLRASPAHLHDAIAMHRHAPLAAGAVWEHRHAPGYRIAEDGVRPGAAASAPAWPGAATPGTEAPPGDHSLPAPWADVPASGHRRRPASGRPAPAAAAGRDALQARLSDRIHRRLAAAGWSSRPVLRFSGAAAAHRDVSLTPGALPDVSHGGWWELGLDGPRAPGALLRALARPRVAATEPGAGADVAPGGATTAPAAPPAGAPNAREPDEPSSEAERAGTAPVLAPPAPEAGRPPPPAPVGVRDVVPVPVAQAEPAAEGAFALLPGPEPAEDDLGALADKLGRILEQEARRHGIDV